MNVTAATYLLSSFGITNAMALPLGATAPAVHNPMQPVINPLDYFLNAEFEAEGNTLLEPSVSLGHSSYAGQPPSEQADTQRNDVMYASGLVPRAPAPSIPEQLGKGELLQKISQASGRITEIKKTRTAKIKDLMVSYVQATPQELLESPVGASQTIKFATTVTEKNSREIQDLARDVKGKKGSNGKFVGPGKKVGFKMEWEAFVKVEEDLKKAYKEYMALTEQLVNVWMNQRVHLSKDDRNQLQTKLAELDTRLLLETKTVLGSTKNAADICHRKIQDAIVKLNSEGLGEPEVAPEPKL
ncbi:hypothetical protein H0H93_010268 [Arthromyces matolae]|nr:hypothetical protein H0H93_010268 [Arthromyces matolae]